ncbi:MAG: ABC transporter ATP-binding protein [Clostridiales Family XIII bacterium]|nr:ABC transporter ATP-binding protein [Clostridiales Family XIII bacterium]
MQENDREPIIVFDNFGFQYFSQAEPTLAGIDLKIYPGEKALIVGPSGSGKSTLGHCLNGLIPFAYKGKQTGTLTIAGACSQEQTIFDRSKVVGTVLQDSDGQFVGLTVGEDIAFALENDCMATPEMHRRVEQAAAMVDMDSHLKNSPNELSGGQKQRTALAGVMIDDVQILLFDEPLANLDPATGKTAIEIIDNIHRDTDKTVIIIEHRLEDVLHRPVDRVIVVDDGRIVADMTPDELLCAGVLRAHGIREPLYVTALKYAGVSLTPDMRPSHVESIDLTDADTKLRRWLTTVQRDTAVNQNPPVLSVEDVSFSYDGKRDVLKDVSFEIRQGEMVSIVGRNGAGKTTITQLMCGFETEHSGIIRYQGEDIAPHSIRERAEYLGLVMQNPNQMISEAMIADEVGLGLKLRGIPSEERAERVNTALRVCDLSPYRSWPIAALSFGQKKRVTIASMLTLNPKVLILDEPTAGQDFRHYTEIMRFLARLNEDGLTVVLITHDMHLMLEYTPRAIVLSDGEVIADAPASEVLTDAGVIERANLKETSLYTLTQRAHIESGTDFVQSFIDHEKWLRSRSDDGDG